MPSSGISTGNSSSYHVTPWYAFNWFLKFYGGRFHKRPLQGNVKILILCLCTCLGMPRSTIKHVQTDFLFDVTVLMFVAEWHRQTDQTFHNRSSTLHFTVKRILLSCPQFDRLTWGIVPLPAYIELPKTHRDTSLPNEIKKKKQAKCFVSSSWLPSRERSPNPLNPLHYVSLLNEDWSRPNCMKLYVGGVTHWRKLLLVLATRTALAYDWGNKK